MSLDALRDTLPAYAKDLSLNLSSLAAETYLLPTRSAPPGRQSKEES